MRQVYGFLRRTLGRHPDRGIAALVLFLIAGLAWPWLSPAPVRASDTEVDDLKAVVLSDVGLSQRLMALEALKKKGSAAALDALSEIASAGEVHVAAASCAQLGRAGGATAKGKLKTVLENTAISKEVRMAAAASIAEHWKDQGDISYLEGKCSGDSALDAFVGTLKSKVYKVE